MDSLFSTRDPFIFTRPWKLDFVFALPSYDLSTYLPDIRLPLIEREIPDCLEHLSNYREREKETARRVLEASLYPLGLQIFSSFQRDRYPSLPTSIIDDGVGTLIPLMRMWIYQVWTREHYEKKSFFIRKLYSYFISE